MESANRVGGREHCQNWPVRRRRRFTGLMDCRIERKIRSSDNRTNLNSDRRYHCQNLDFLDFRMVGLKGKSDHPVIGQIPACQQKTAVAGRRMQTEEKNVFRTSLNGGYVVAEPGAYPIY